MTTALRAAEARNGKSAHPACDVLIVGCGRQHRCDDQLGLRVAELLADDPPPGAKVMLSEAPGIDLLTYASGERLLIVIDAARGGAGSAPGSWRRLERGASALRLRDATAGGIESGHVLGVADALCVGAVLETLPPEVWIYAVSGEDFGYGDGLSPHVRGAVCAVAHVIRSDVAEWRKRRGAINA